MCYVLGACPAPHCKNHNLDHSEQPSQRLSIVIITLHLTGSNETRLSMASGAESKIGRSPVAAHSRFNIILDHLVVLAGVKKKALKLQLCTGSLSVEKHYPGPPFLSFLKTV